MRDPKKTTAYVAWAQLPSMQSRRRWQQTPFVNTVRRYVAACRCSPESSSGYRHFGRFGEHTRGAKPPSFFSFLATAISTAAPLFQR